MSGGGGWVEVQQTVAGRGPTDWLASDPISGDASRGFLRPGSTATNCVAGRGNVRTPCRLP
eukprot:11322898-Prorocentrum_lima.AAC.1